MPTWIGWRLEPDQQRQVADADGGAQVASMESGQVHLHLLRGTGQGRDRAEVVASELGQRIDQRREVDDRRRLDAPSAAATAAR
jgi:hypothetical protein